MQRSASDARAAETALEELRATASASNTQLEEARFTLQQIEAVNPEGGEYEEIPEEEYDDSPPWDEDGEADADEGGGDE